MSENKYPMWQCLLPFAVSTILLLFGSVSDYGIISVYYSQLALLTGALVATCIAWLHGVRLRTIFDAIVANMRPLLPTILFLFLIRTLCVAWLLGGVIPSGVYFGIKYLSASFFLVTVTLFCGIMSLVCGSSWLTVGTIGVVFLGIGKALGFHEPLVAGAVISGAYFGDKLTPLSETTVLSSSMTGTPLYRHVSYMLWTSIPSFLVTLCIFGIWSFSHHVDVVNQPSQVSDTLIKSFSIHALWLAIPLVLLLLTILQCSPYKTLLIGALLGYIVAFFCQESLLSRMAEVNQLSIWEKVWLLISKTFWGVEKLLIDDSVPAMNKRLASDGIWGMCDTVTVIFVAVILSGSMEGSGLLGSLISRIQHIKSRSKLIVLTTLSAIFFNVTVADQYLSIILTSKMFGKMFEKQGLASENLSRAIEDSATVTSPLIKWNTCGVAQASALGIATISYMPYCFFNWLSPIIGIVLMCANIKIAKKKLNRTSRRF